VLFRTVPSAHTLVRGEDGKRLRRHSADSTWPPLWPTGSSSGSPPSITARCFSSSPSDSTSRWTPCPPRPRLPGPARHYPRFRIRLPGQTLDSVPARRWLASSPVGLPVHLPMHRSPTGKRRLSPAHTNEACRIHRFRRFRRFPGETDRESAIITAHLRRLRLGALRLLHKGDLGGRSTSASGLTMREGGHRMKALWAS
jgi:hypothetical protein